MPKDAMHLKVVLEPSNEGGIYPGLSDCIRERETKDEALINIKEAIEL